MTVPLLLNMDHEVEYPSRRTLFTSAFKYATIVLLAIGFAAIAISNPNEILRSRSQFQSWYHQFGRSFAAAKLQCPAEYEIYLHGTKKNETVDVILGSDSLTMFVTPIIECIINHCSEYIKYSLGTAQVMLGVTPTIVALLGASTEEVCLLALIGRRRLLGLLLASASPSIYTNRAFEYRNAGDILRDRLGREHITSSLQLNWRRTIVVFEYIFAIAALANVATVSWELGVKSINAINPTSTLMPMLWSLLAIPAHLAGAVVFHLKAQRVDHWDPTPQDPTAVSMSQASTVSVVRHWLRRVVEDPWRAVHRWTMQFLNLIRREFCFHPGHSRDEKIFVKWFKESRLFTVLAWMLSVLIVFHIILGTLILSSANFVGPRDALFVMIRYVASVCVCRVILMYELAVVRLGYKNGLDAIARENSQRETLNAQILVSEKESSVSTQVAPRQYLMESGKTVSCPV